mmetsp:Transcript_52001/g.96754  ORF Transcript_52001/g.96754 Transcript_52001/m.96754 type:complete len:190 (+) Transcript_52001:23-592(+)
MRTILPFTVACIASPFAIGFIFKHVRTAMPVIQRGSSRLMMAIDDGAPDETAKRIKRLKKDLKRIGELRKLDYLTLKTDQRVKVHSEPDVLVELRSLMDLDEDELEIMRCLSQPGLEIPMPPSQGWTYERSVTRAKAKTQERRQLQASLGLKGKARDTVVVRKGDWRCDACGTLCFGSRETCFKCKEPQ